MKTQLLRTMGFCLAGALLATSAFAQRDEGKEKQNGKDPTVSPTGRPASQAGQHHSLRASKLMGASVKGTQGDSVGQIEDVIVNPQAGRVEFAVIAVGEKLTPVPWQLLSPQPMATPGSPTGRPGQTGQQPSFILNVEKEKLQQAPSYEKNKWPDMSQADWSQRIYSHFGVQPETGTGGTGAGAGTGTGTGAGTQDPTKPSKPPGAPENP